MNSCTDIGLFGEKTVQLGAMSSRDLPWNCLFLMETELYLDDCTSCVRVRACVHVCVLLGEYRFMKTCLVHVANGSSTGQVQKTSFYLKVVTNNQQ